VSGWLFGKGSIDEGGSSKLRKVTVKVGEEYMAKGFAGKKGVCMYPCGFKERCASCIIIREEPRTRPVGRKKKRPERALR